MMDVGVNVNHGSPKAAMSNWKVPCDENEGSGESGIDESDFQTIREDSVKQFARQLEESESASFSFEDLWDTLSTKKITRTSLLSRVELDPSNRLLLQEDRSNVRAKFGYDMEKRGYLYPEEALYLLDLGKVEIFCNNVSLSVQRARSLLLQSVRSSDVDKIMHCTEDEFLVYKCLSRMGYCLYRVKSRSDYDNSPVRQKNVSHSHDESESDVMEEGDGEEDEMEGELNDVIITAHSGDESRSTDTEDIIELNPKSYKEPAGGQTRGLKRKFPSGVDDEEDESEISDEDMTGTVYAELHNSFIDQESYTVDEADSDIEIVDEVIFSHGGVEIQEIGHSVGFQEDCSMDVQNEPIPSTSKGPQLSQVVVDLVSSDDEDEQDLKMFESSVWSSFVPNAKLTFSVPPSALIPESIPYHDTLYEFDLKDKSDISDLELEFLVDEVSLNDDSYDTSNYLNLSAAKSWKEWRQNIFREARDVMNESLLASSEYINGEAAADKLFLWKESLGSGISAPAFLNIIFEMYGPVAHGFSRSKAKEEKPAFYVLITRQDDKIPDFGLLDSSIDGVPILIAVVCDNGNDVVFMTGDRSPLESLF